MSLHRFFLEGPLSEGAAALAERDVHHVRDVLRLRPGARMVLVGQDGAQAIAELTASGPGGVEVSLGERLEVGPEPFVALVQGVSRRERMETAVQKAVEVGVSEVVPMLTARSVVRLDAAKAEARRERWARIAEEAAKQSQRPFVPPVRPVASVADVAAALRDYDRALVLWEEASGAGVREALAGARPEERVTVVVGPEGGLDAAEVDTLVAAGAVPVTLGPTILRTETAAVVAAALAIHELGGLGGSGR